MVDALLIRLRLHQTPDVELSPRSRLLDLARLLFLGTDRSCPRWGWRGSQGRPACWLGQRPAVAELLWPGGAAGWSWWER